MIIGRCRQFCVSFRSWGVDDSTLYGRRKNWKLPLDLTDEVGEIGSSPAGSGSPPRARELSLDDLS